MSLVEILRRWARDRPGQGGYTFLDSAGAESETLLFGALDARARAVAAALQAHGAAGERALLLYPPGLDFVVAFLGCLYGGTIAVPAYPPRPNRGQARLRSIAADAGARIVLTSAAMVNRMAPLLGQTPELAGARWLATDDLPAGIENDWREALPAAGDPAFLQYTSGSTADPKGVIVSHGNLLHNEEMIRRAFAQSESSVVVGWLPLYHDMGLIGNVLQPLYLGARAILMSPLTFLQKPARWLEAVSRYRATTSGGPNFAYELCLRKIGAAEREALDLSSWRLAFSGAEPVRSSTLEEFAAAFAPCGFERAAFYPCYGLAEATLFATGGEVAARPRVAAFASAALEDHRVAPAVEPGGRELVSCGRPWLGQEIAIVDPESRRRCPPDRVGEIWLAGPSVAQGYWRRPEATVEEFQARLVGEAAAGPFLRTGDLGFLHGGDLFVTGRLKDLVILGGRNLYPQDVELAVERAHPALRPGCGAAFAVEAEREERLVIVWELDARAAATVEDLEAVAGAIRQKVGEDLEAAVHEVVLIATGTLLKTSSGKVRRRACRDAYLRGGLEVVGRSAEGPAPEPLDGGLGLVARLRGEVARAARVPLSLVVPGEPLTRLGLDSLAAVELSQGLEERFGASLSVADLLGGITVDGLARQLLSQAPAKSVDPPLVPRPLPEADSPLSHGQKALWFLDRLVGESGPFHIAAAARVEGALDVAALERALHQLAGRHPVLRTTFHEGGGEPRQRVHPDLAPDFVIEDAASWSEGELTARLEEEAYRPFDLRTGPLLRLAVFRRAAAESAILLAVHHVVADFWTLALWVRELAALYAGKPLPPLSLTHADYVSWQEARLAGPEGERLWEHWRARLAPPLPQLLLPTDRARPPVQSYRGGAEPLRFGPELSRELAALARASGATLFTALLAGFQALLHRYTGQDDLLVGSPAAGRGRPELAGVAGYFVNPLVLRADLAGDPPFAAVLGQARETVLQALAHQDYPFLLLAERLQPDRDLSRSPLLQTMFVWQKAERPEEAGLAAWALGEAGSRLAFGDLVFESRGVPERFSQFDLMLRMAEVDGALVASLQYDSALFDAATARRMLGHLRELLAGAAADPGLTVGALPLLTAPERAQLLVDWNPGESPAAEATLHELFAAQAARSPGAEALVVGGERLTYGELAARAARLAEVLRRHGVAPEVRVAVCLERSAALVVALLGTLTAGGAYVPLDPAYPPERRALMLEDSGARLLLTQADLAGQLPGSGARTLLLDGHGQAIGAVPGAPALPPAFPALTDNLAYLIYTSGSTGRPKAVALAHRGAVALVRWARGRWNDAELSGVLFATSVCFDLSVFELFVPLSWGGRVIVAEDALALPRLPAAREVTLVNTVPSAMAELVRQRSLPASVRTVNLAGEALKRPLVEALYGLGTVEKVWNLYGPSEATVYSTGALQAPGGEGAPGIGRPIDGTRGYVLDRGMELAPAGVPGELYLGGAGLARGYLGRSDLTAERFRPDPCSGRPGGRLYATGDRVRHGTEGELEYLGRLDHQAKVRGFRVEPGEIEAVLAGHPEVAEATVAVFGDEGDKRLAAYVVARPGAIPEIDELRAFLQARLPAHMVPAAFVFLPELPRTAVGKLDRKALPNPENAFAVPAFVAPRSALEAGLAAIWERVLGVPGVGVHDDFFALGGHSLKATQVLAAARDAFGADLPVRSLFEAPTVARLAAAVARDLEGRGGWADEGIRPRLPDSPPVLSFAQERLWFLDQLQPGSAAYNLPAAVRLAGRLDAAALARALGEIVRRHAALRTTFAAGVDGAPAPTVAPPKEFALPEVDLGGLPVGLREREARRLSELEARRPFDLAAGPLPRVTLLRLGGEELLMLLSQHHIVSDGWSIGVLVRELGHLYAAFAAGLPSPLPELPIQYADYAAWQREWLAGEVLERQLAYWRGQLAGAPALLELPADRPRPPVQSWRGGRLAVSLPAAGLQALARRRQATLFMVLVAGVAALLSRLTGQEDLAIGSPIAGRGRPETADLIGFFANTLVLRASLAGDPAFGELLARVREASLGAYAHQDLPFERLVEELSPERSLAHSPLFQVMVVLQNAPAAALELPGLRLQPVELATGVAKLDLALTLAEDGPRLAGSLEYALDLFDGPAMSHWRDRLARLLAAAAADPGRRLSELPLLSAAERQQLLEWNATAAPGPDACLHELVEAQVARTPDAVAVEFEARALTYRELDARANRLAHRLAALGVGPEARVGILAERSLAMVIGLLAVLKAGGAYVPLDPGHPAERLAFVIEEAGIAVLLAGGRLAGRLPASGARIVPLDAGDPELAAWPASRPPAAVTPGNLAYVIYTSGSTGRPKGAMNSHRGVVNRLAWMQGVEPLDATDAVLQKTPYGFDISVWEIFWPLASGARLVMAVPGGHQDPDYLAATVESRGITTLHFVPSMLPAFLEARSLERCSSLRRVITSGEALPADHVTAFFARFPRVALFNLYGPTEAAIEVTVWRCERHAEARAVPIGRPIDNLRIHLLDSGLAPVPPGVAGELYIGGVGVARGYVSRPGLTAERFLPEPAAGELGTRMYRTGDLARFRADGAVEYLGRVDHQVKIHGFRIELGEIEAVLGTHPDVRQTVVLARTDSGNSGGAPRLVAYAVAREGAAPSPAELSRHLAAALPAYMVPASFVLLPALPLNANGKVDRKALPAPAAPERLQAAPRTEAEAALVEIWRELLRTDGVGVHDNFFELGGNSLQVMRLRSRLRSVLGADLPLAAFFEAQTVALQAALAVEALRTAGGAAPPPLVPMTHDGDPPLSFAQERLWFLDQLEPGSPVYNLPAAVRLEGELDPRALRWAIERVVERHAALRTTIRTSAGRPVQAVAPRLAVPLPLIDLTALATLAASAEAEAGRLAAAAALSPFDLAAGPLLRAVLLRLGGERHVLLVTCHHIVTDGWSLGIFFDELAAFYEAARGGREPGLAALPVQYADFAVWQRGWLQGEELERLLAYWRRRLAGAPSTLELPLDHPRPAVQTYRGAGRSWQLGAGAAAALRAFGRGEGATLFMTLLAAFATVFHRYSGQRDLVLGTPTANRGQVEIEPLIGFFANSLALRLDLAEDPPFRAFLARVRAAVLTDYAHQEVPFEKLVEDLRPERDLSHNPIYQVVFALESSERERGLDLPGLRLTPLPAAGGTAKFDFALYMEDRGGSLSGLLETNRDLFDPATGARWLGHFQTLIEAALSAPERRLSELPLLRAVERHQLLLEANDTARAAPAEAFVHRLFEARAAAAPAAPAVSQEGRRLTYGELNGRANQLARRLRALGVGPEVRVAVSVERSPELIVALLGVLKAGGAYVPLDPTYPQDRLAFLLADSKASVLLTQEALAERFSGVTTLLVDAGWEDFAGEAADDLAAPLSPGNLAYVIYTSGSTGRPKGVMIEHRSLASYTATAARAYSIEAADRVLQFCSISFDISIEEIVPCLAGGAELVLRTDAMVESIAAFLAACRERSLSVLSLPTAYWHEITARVEAEGLELPPSLRLVIIAGERALPERLAAWRRRAPARPRLVNTYGLTESTIISTLADLTASPGADGTREVPIGRTIPDSEIHLLDRALEPVPLGTAGEIYIGGGLLARGYLHRPEVTAERFVPHVFARLPGARLYRTGDLGRRLPGGDLEFLGRGDQQVKVRGYRIELGEIETALAEHPAAAAAAVTLREDRPGQKRLVAYIAMGASRPAASLEELRAFLRRRLPDYMQPAAFVFLEAMPLTPNGKVDRAALPAPHGERPGLEAEYVPPGDEMEVAIAAIWAEALGLARVGLNDNFFDLGGHSLLLIQIHDRLRERLGRSLPIVDLFKHPTVGSLARHLESEREEAAPVASVVQDRAARSRAAMREERYLKARGRLR